MAQHAYLSASSAYRWLVCPPLVSVEANSGIQERYSPYAAEGTEAHTLGELKLRQFLGEDVTGQINTFKGTAEFYDDEMDKHTDTYVDRVIEEFNQHPGAQLELEVKVDFSHWVPKGFGTSDAVIISDGLVEVIDLKYGKGVPVSAYQNPQLMLYALGAFARYDFIYDFEQVKMTIIQPRLDNFSTFTLDVPELLYWADNYVAPRAAEAYEGRGEWTIDKDVMRFSKVRGNLRPRAQLNFKLIDDYIETEPALLGNSEIGKILERSDEIESWLKDVQAYALNPILQKGEKVDG